MNQSYYKNAKKKKKKNKKPQQKRRPKLKLYFQCFVLIQLQGGMKFLSYNMRFYRTLQLLFTMLKFNVLIH